MKQIKRKHRSHATICGLCAGTAGGCDYSFDSRSKNFGHEFIRSLVCSRRQFAETPAIHFFAAQCAECLSRRRQRRRSREPERKLFGSCARESTRNSIIRDASAECESRGDRGRVRSASPAKNDEENVGCCAAGAGIIAGGITRPRSRVAASRLTNLCTGVMQRSANRSVAPTCSVTATPRRVRTLTDIKAFNSAIDTCFALSIAARICC